MGTGRWLLFGYLAAAAAYGGWRGPDLWSGWGVWAVLLAPAFWAAARALRTGSGMPPVLRLAMPVPAAIDIGGPAVVLAWAAGAWLGQYLPDPPGRAAAGLALGLAACGMGELAHRSRSKAPGGEQPQPEDVPETPRQE